MNVTIEAEGAIASHYISRNEESTLWSVLDVPPFAQYLTRRGELLKEPQRHVAVIGAGIAGTEAAALLANAGIMVTVFEQYPHVGGKILGGLPFWHEKQRNTELMGMLGKLCDPHISYVPSTSLNKTLTADELLGMGYDHIVVATGAWEDNILKANGTPIEELVAQGFEYQNFFIQRLNEWWAQGKDFRDFKIGDEGRTGARIVVGGGLA